MKKRLPLSAYDPRLLLAWQRGATTPTLIAEVHESLSPDAYRTRSNKLIRLSQQLHEVRSAAQQERAPGWEALYQAIQRKTYDAHHRLVRITIEPRALATDDLLEELGALPPPPPVADDPRPSHNGSALPPMPEDILADIFGPPHEQ